MAAAVLPDVGGRALVAVIGWRAVVEGNSTGNVSGNINAMIADRVGQALPIMGAVIAGMPRVDALVGCTGQRWHTQCCRHGGGDQLPLLHLDSPESALTRPCLTLFRRQSNPSGEK